MTAAAILDDAALFQRWRDRRDRCARDELVTRYLPRAHRVARRFHSRSEPLDDLQQVAGIGLVKAVERFDPEQGATFWTFALPTVTGELKRHFRDYCWTVHVPRSIQDGVLRVQAAITMLSADLGRSPSVSELAEALDMPAEEVMEALEAGSAFDPRSLDQPLVGEAAGTLGDTLGGGDAGLDAAERRAMLAPALRSLPARERLVLQLRFEHDLTQTEIAERIGVSQMHVSRIIRNALARMRDGAELAGAA